MKCHDLDMIYLQLNIIPRIYFSVFQQMKIFGYRVFRVITQFWTPAPSEESYEFSVVRVRVRVRVRGWFFSELAGQILWGLPEPILFRKMAKKTTQSQTKKWDVIFDSKQHKMKELIILPRPHKGKLWLSNYEPKSVWGPSQVQDTHLWIYVRTVCY